MNVIVTGAGGFIGGFVMRYFRDKGYDVTGWDINPDVDSDISALDMCTQSEVEMALEGVHPDIIIHCAGSADVSRSVSDPDLDMMLNVGITHNLLFAMFHHGLKDTRLVYLSSAAVYGNPKHLPVREDAARNPVSPYALHKTMCEDMCRYFIENHEFDIRIARIFSAYGAGLKKQIFWDMYNRYITTGRLDMYGTGHESRDFINIEDLVCAIYLLATADYEERVINVANGCEVTIREIVETFAAYMDIPESAIAFNGMSRPGDPLNWCADISLLTRLGYKPSVSMNEGIVRYCDWARTQQR